MTPLEATCPHCGKTLDSAATGATHCPHCGATPGGRAPAIEPEAEAAGDGPLLHPRGRALALTGGAVATIAIAGIVIFASLRDELGRWWTDSAARDKAARAAAAQPAAKDAGQRRYDPPDPGEVRTPLVVLRAGDGGDAGPVVALARPTGPTSVDIIAFAKQPILFRELVRQAMLIAARDELGIPTRDEVLDDAPPVQGQKAGEPIEVASVFRGQGSWAIVRRGEAGKAETLVKAGLGHQPDHLDYPGQLARMAEALSRSEFPGFLKKLGLDGTPNRISDGAPVPADVERWLDSLGLVDNFAAVRALHDAIRANGESPARLAALARGYAQLGVLSEYQWSPAHCGFKARAMLYAERSLARAPKSPQPLWTRAFVRALVGFHAEALADIAEARKLATANYPPAPEPSWVRVIEAYATNDQRKLEIKQGPDVKLATLLRMFNREYPHHARAAVLAAREVLNVDADCYRAYDVICSSGQLGDLHIVTTMGPDTFSKLFPIKLKSIRSLPADVRQPLDKGRDELTIVDALEKAGRPGGDRGEPPWGVLAHLAREVRFAQAWRRMHFMAYKWSVPVGDYWADVQPFVAHHRFAPYLESLTLPPPQARDVMARLADGLNPTDLELTEQDLYHRFQQLKITLPDKFWGYLSSHSEAGARDFSENLALGNSLKLFFSHGLLEISPYSAFAMAQLVEHDWERVQRQVGPWREKVHDAPALLNALAKKYAALKKYDEAVKCLQKYIEQSPDRAAFELLASCYLAQGDRDRWRATLDDYLAKTEDAGLEHAQVRVQIANYLMTREKWAEAKKYAEPAAETWAAWAMQCASRCNEGLQDWERAELWIRRTAERYPGSSWAGWYLFCRRTGHGDIEAARAFAQEYLAATEGRPDLADPHQVGFFYWATGSPKPALENLKKSEEAQPSALHGFCTMLLADELGDKVLRDRMLGEICAKLEEKFPRMVALAGKIREAHADGGEFPLDLAAVDKMLVRWPANTRGNANFFVGKYLLNRRQPESARKYLQQAADAPETQVWLRLIADDALRALDAKKPH